MNFDSYSGRPVTLAVDLVNSEKVVSGNDRLTDAEAASAFLRAHEIARPLAPAALSRLLALRTRLRDVFESTDDITAGERINALLVDHHATPRVSWHGGGPLHMHFESTQMDVVDEVGAMTAMGLAVVLCDHGVQRLGICDSPRCDDVYVDTSKNRTKRYCGDVCARRESVNAFRARSRATRDA